MSLFERVIALIADFLCVYFTPKPVFADMGWFFVSGSKSPWFVCRNGCCAFFSVRYNFLFEF